MKKNLFFLLIVSLVSCSTEDNNTASFSINLVSSETTVSIDQAFTITVDANEEIKELWASTDNFATGGYAIRQFGTSHVLNFNFDTLGQKRISVRAKNQDNVVSENQVIVTVSRGNALKINGVQIISFYGINTTYDPEFPTTSPNHLADLRFGLSKNKLGNPLDNIYSPVFWYLSNIIENQGNMTWDCSNAELFINQNASLKFGLADIDNGIAGADLLNGPPDYREISFSNYIETKPTTITYTFPEINLEFKLFVEWVN
ncbi:hypothetical protein [Flavobacterium sp. UBA7663]|uniref:hypothetical protein n=1 Tax=Flavobacterium sp. UBA7663 TaxID=1946557 RepID=UPI0025C6FF7D|nr:hypothetical protein [Flavobacterium sp. UBA7663]